MEMEEHALHDMSVILCYYTSFFDDFMLYRFWDMIALISVVFYLRISSMWRLTIRLSME